MNQETELGKLLKEWDPKPGSDRFFNRSVWSRIEAAESRANGIPSPLLWIRGLATPRMAVVCLATALFGGILLGGLQAFSSSQEERYLLSVNPFASALPGR
jgi:hypothetical protein